VQTSTTVVQTSTVVLSRAITLYPLRLLVPTAVFIATVVIVVGVGIPGNARFYQAAASIIVCSYSAWRPRASSSDWTSCPHRHHGSSA
jgi:hypothetical protein